jgi:NADH-quinone oxidoreductase subunit M
MYVRLHTRDMRQMGGLWARFRYLPPIALFFAAASLGLPGMGNFVGEFLILLGTFQVNPLIAVISATGLILAAVYALIMMQRAFYGTPKTTERMEDLSSREIALMTSLIAILLFLGLHPQTVLNTSAAAMANVHHVYAPAMAAALSVSP